MYPQRVGGWLLGLLLVLGLVVAPSSAALEVPDPGGQPEAVAQGKPDIIVIMTDDQRAGTETVMPFTWSFFGSRGVRYEFAEVPTNLCCPARTSFLTGEYSHTTGVWENHGDNGGFDVFKKWAGPTLPENLQSVGYETSLVGKYVNHYRRTSIHGKAPAGWDVFHALDSNGKGGRGKAYWNPPPGLPKGYMTDILGDAVVDQIQSASADTPQFIYYAPPAPHNPSDAGPYRGAANEALLRQFRRAGHWRNPAFLERDVGDKPPWIRKRPPREKRLRRMVDRQSVALLGVDANVGKIIRAQERHRDLSNTVIVYLTDNGYSWGEHRLHAKRNPYLLSSRIPLLVKYPDGVEVSEPPGTTSTRLANQLDVTATLAQLAGSAPTGVGLSLLGPQRTSLPLEAIRRDSRTRPRPAYCGIRTRRFLYLRYADGNREFYDYTRDPYELHNKAGSARYRHLQREASTMLHPDCRLTELRKLP